MLVIVLAVLLALAALLAVAYPIWQKARESQIVTVTGGNATEALEELLAQRDAAFQALRDLNFDRQVGKVAGEDFAVFEAGLKHGAAETLRALDQWEAGVDADLAPVFQRDLPARRAALAGGATAAGAANGAGLKCPSCGHRLAPADQFCTRCGKPVPALVTPQPVNVACPTCGRPYAPGDSFCAGCGRRLPATERARTIGG